MPRYGSIDIGSNSVLLLVAEQAPDGGLRTVDDRTTTTRLSEGLAGSGVLSDAAMARTRDVVVDYVAAARAAGAEAIVAGGTAPLRMASNAKDFVDAVQAACGLHVETLSGEEEAALTFAAARASFPPETERVLVADIGGASTELVPAVAGRAVGRSSLPIGAVRLTERFLATDPPTPTERDALAAHAEALLRPALAAPSAELVVGGGGTLTTMAAVHHSLDPYAAEVVEGTRLTREDVAVQVARYAARTVAARREIVGLAPARADVILAGALVAQAILAASGASTLLVTARGVRHGLWLREFSERSR